MSSDQHDLAGRRDALMATWIDVTIRLGILGLLIYLSFILVRPFISIAIWSVVLTIALYPIYSWMVERLGGRRRLAAVLLTILNLVIVIGPVTWLALGLIDSFQTLSQRLDPSALELPPPPATLKSWPFIGDPIYQFWVLASTNLEAAFAKVVPHLRPLGSTLLHIATEAGTSTLKFFVAIIVAGFLFSPAPRLLDAVVMFSRRIASGRGEEFVNLAGATIRAVARGVIGISALQAFLAGVGLMAAGVPGTSFITSAVLILGNHSDRAINRSHSADHLELDGNGNDDRVAVHRLYGPGQSAGQHPAAPRHGARIEYAHADHSDGSDRRYYLVRDQRVVSGPDRPGRHLGAAHGVEQGAIEGDQSDQKGRAGLGGAAWW